jgi:hypothetical protein
MRVCSRCTTPPENEKSPMAVGPPGDRVSADAEFPHPHLMDF